MNSHRAHSLWQVALLAAVIAITPLAIDTYLPAMPIIARDLHGHIGDVQQSLSIYLAAYALGMLLFGPLADAVGRRPLALFGLGGFTLCSLGLGFVENVSSLLVLRALQAFCGSAATVVVPGIVRHLYQEHTAKGMSYLSMIMMLAPLLAPSLGSFILWFSQWRTIFFVLAAYGLVTSLVCWRSLPEVTSQRQSPNLRFLLSNYRHVFSNRLAQPFILSMMFGSFAFFCFITAVSFVYIDYFGVSEQLFSLLFGFNVVSLMVANFVNSRWVTRVGSLTMLRAGLIGALVFSSLLCAVTLLKLGLWYTVLSIAPLMASLVIVSTNTDALVLLQFPQHSGTSTAVTGTLRYGSGAVAGPLLAWLHNGTPEPFALLMFAGVAGVIICQAWAQLLRKKIA